MGQEPGHRRRMVTQSISGGAEVHTQAVESPEPVACVTVMLRSTGQRGQVRGQRGRVRGQRGQVMSGDSVFWTEYKLSLVEYIGIAFVNSGFKKCPMSSSKKHLFRRPKLIINPLSTDLWLKAHQLSTPYRMGGKQHHHGGRRLLGRGRQS